MEAHTNDQDQNPAPHREASTDVRELGARLLESHGVAAVGCRDGVALWANRVALDLVDPLDRDEPDAALLELLARGLRLPDDVKDIGRGEERAIEIELAANRALLRLPAVAVGGTDHVGPTVLVTFRAPLEQSVDPAHVARLEAMLDTTSDIITVIGRDGRVLFSNPAAGRLTGLAGAEANGLDMFSFVHPEDVEAVSDAWVAGVVNGQAIEPFELRLQMADGEWRNLEAHLRGPVDVDGVEGFVATLRDISDRVRREHEIEVHKRRLESVVENIDDVVVIIGADYSIKWSSPGIERLVDAPAYTHVGLGPFGDMHEDDAPRVLEALELASASAGGRSRADFRLDHAKRGWRWIEASVVNRLDDPAIDGLVCTLRDVTAQRDHDAELGRLRAQEREEVVRLREADRLKDTFLATVSHELRTPLTSVRGFSSLLQGQWDQLGSEERLQIVDRIAANASSMEVMVEQLLDYSRLEAGRVEVVLEALDLSPIVAEMVDGLAHQLRDHEVVVDVDGLRVVGDRRGLDHVLRNLLTNAARYSNTGTRIEVEAERTGDVVAVRVRDHGIGIAPEDQIRVFQSFFQSAPAATARRGTGVGLNVARRYAQLQHGQLRLESELGVGSTFTLTLPAAD